MQDAQVWRRQVQGLARTLGRLEERLQSQVALEADLARKNAQLSQREDHCRLVERALAQSQAALAESQRGMAELLASRSWRLMAPYRLAGRVFRRWFSGAKV